MDEGGIDPVTGQHRDPGARVPGARDRGARGGVGGEAVIARVNTLDLPLAVWCRLLMDAGRRLGVAVSAVPLADNDNDNENAVAQFVLVLTRGQHERGGPARGDRDEPQTNR